MQTNPAPASAQSGAADGGFDIRHISASQLAELGVTQLAYIRPVLVDPVLVDAGPAFAIHAADGRPLGVAPTIETAASAIREHGMIPTLVQ